MNDFTITALIVVFPVLFVFFCTIFSTHMSRSGILEYITYLATWASIILSNGSAIIASWDTLTSSCTINTRVIFRVSILVGSITYSFTRFRKCRVGNKITVTFGTCSLLSSTSTIFFAFYTFGMDIATMLTLTTMLVIAIGTFGITLFCIVLKIFWTVAR